MFLSSASFSSQLQEKGTYFELKLHVFLRRTTRAFLATSQIKHDNLVFSLKRYLLSLYETLLVPLLKLSGIKILLCFHSSHFGISSVHFGRLLVVGGRLSRKLSITEAQTLFPFSLIPVLLIIFACVYVVGYPY